MKELINVEILPHAILGVMKKGSSYSVKDILFAMGYSYGKNYIKQEKLVKNIIQKFVILGILDKNIHRKPNLYSRTEGE